MFRRLIARPGYTLLIVLTLAFALVRTVRALLYGVTPTDPVSFASVIVLLIVVALLACSLPTRKAMRVHQPWPCG